MVNGLIDPRGLHPICDFLFIRHNLLSTVAWSLSLFFYPPSGLLQRIRLKDTDILYLALLQSITESCALIMCCLTTLPTIACFTLVPTSSVYVDLLSNALLNFIPYPYTNQIRPDPCTPWSCFCLSPFGPISMILIDLRLTSSTIISYTRLCVWCRDSYYISLT